MKIENRGVIPIETARTALKKAKATQASQTNESKKDLVDSKLSQALQDTVKGIQERQMTPAEVHSDVDEVRASGLLKSMDVEGSKQRLSDEELLKLADKVASDSQANPDQAMGAFNEFKSERVSSLFEG